MMATVKIYAVSPGPPIDSRLVPIENEKEKIKKYKSPLPQQYGPRLTCVATSYWQYFSERWTAYPDHALKLITSSLSSQYGT